MKPESPSMIYLSCCKINPLAYRPSHAPFLRLNIRGPLNPVWASVLTQPRSRPSPQTSQAYSQRPGECIDHGFVPGNSAAGMRCLWPCAPCMLKATSASGRAEASLKERVAAGSAFSIRSEEERAVSLRSGPALGRDEQCCVRQL